jgi:plasmid stabilization system protein ParE
MARLRKTSLADADITAAILHLREKNPLVAMVFVDALEQTLARIREFPELFPMRWRSARPELANVRCAVVRRFGYLIFYRVEADAILILRVMHGSRNEP